MEKKEKEKNQVKMKRWTLIFGIIYTMKVPKVTILYKQMILLSKALMQDDTHQAILHTVQKAREEEDMDFCKALD